MTPTRRRMHVLVPFWGLAGGVIKLLDYANHAAQLDMSVTLWAPPLPDPDDFVHTLPVLSELRATERVTFATKTEIAGPGDLLGSDGSDDDIVLFTDPTDHAILEAATPQWFGPRLVHLIQGTRHANPRWQDGRNFRLLHLPMTRIAVAPEVATAISPFANSTHPLHTVMQGHDVDYFAGRPRPDGDTAPQHLRVLYMTWKSDLGDRVANELADDDRFRFVAIRTPLGWPSLRNRYHGADVFLAAPGPEEGFYLPGLEAMAAGLPVVTALVGGNASYVDHGKNALVVRHNDVTTHVDALVAMVEDEALRTLLARNGEHTATRHSLANERSQFAAILDALDR